MGVAQVAASMLGLDIKSAEALVSVDALTRCLAWMQQVDGPQLSLIHISWRRFKKNKLALFGLIFLILITLAAIIIPMVSPFTYDGQDLANRNALPNMVHLMGTDKLGRDIMVLSLIHISMFLLFRCWKMKRR